MTVANPQSAVSDSAKISRMSAILMRRTGAYAPGPGPPPLAPSLSSLRYRSRRRQLLDWRDAGSKLHLSLDSSAVHSLHDHARPSSGTG
jgi:hypothetical protein